MGGCQTPQLIRLRLQERMAVLLGELGRFQLSFSVITFLLSVGKFGCCILVVREIASISDCSLRRRVATAHQIHIHTLR